MGGGGVPWLVVGLSTGEGEGGRVWTVGAVGAFKGVGMGGLSVYFSVYLYPLRLRAFW